MNATIQTILSRRSVRRYTDRPVDDAVLNEIVRTAIYAPSAMAGSRIKLWSSATRRHWPSSTG